MLGGIYCTVCGRPIDGRVVVQCDEHPGRFRVKFPIGRGRNITPAFRSLLEAEQALNDLRVQRRKGVLDPRDWMRDEPLSFRNVARAFELSRRGKVKPKTLSVYSLYLARAEEAWGDRNVKHIRYADIERFIDGQDVGPVTRKRIRDVLHGMFRWALRCRMIDGMPEFPECKATSAMRRIVDAETQQRIIDEVYRISSGVNPKIWLGIDILATSIALRPGELLRTTEGDINVPLRLIVVPDPKERKPKLVPLSEEHVDAIRSMPTGLPDLPFFRHPPSYSNSQGRRFGEKYLYKWWKRACANLGIDGVDLYGGTRHSTACAMRVDCSPEQVRAATMHSTSAAFDRYFQRDLNEIRQHYERSKQARERFSSKTRENEPGMNRVSSLSEKRSPKK